MSQTASSARFSIGELVTHSLFNYRGVIIDVDPVFMGTEQWYQHMALSRPPKDRPWYRVLVHNAVHETYVAERNLEPDYSTEAIQHPMIEVFFAEFNNGVYSRRLPTN